jgi:hypothetical protein
MITVRIVEHVGVSNGSEKHPDSDGLGQSQLPGFGQDFLGFCRDHLYQDTFRFYSRQIISIYNWSIDTI